MSTGVLSCNALISRMSSEKSFVTILAAIRSQEKKRENGPLQEALPVRSSHIRTMTLRASSCSPHKTELYLVPERRKSAGKMANCLGSQPGPLITTAQGNCTLLRTSLTRQPAAYRSTSDSLGEFRSDECAALFLGRRLRVWQKVPPERHAFLVGDNHFTYAWVLHGRAFASEAKIPRSDRRRGYCPVDSA